MAEHEKNVDAEIKRKHEEFDKDIEAYLNQFRTKASPGLSPSIQGIRGKVKALRNRFSPIRK